MNQPEPPLGSWDTEALEKVLVGFINEMYTNCSGMTQRQAFTTKDFLNLTPTKFREIVGFIFHDRGPAHLKHVLESRENKLVKQESFNELHKNFNVSFNLEPVLLYSELKRLFPPDLDLMRPSVVLNPAGDPLRTRKVLRYLTGLLVFIEDVYEDVESTSDQVKAEFDENEALAKRLNDLKVEINKKQIEQDTWKTDVGVLKKQSQVKKAEIEKLEKATAEFEERVRKESGTYNKLVDEKHATYRELDLVLQELEEMSNQIVSSPEKILKNIEAERFKLQELTQLRDSCSQKIQACSQESTRVAMITEEAGKTISFFQDLVRLMEEAMDAKDSWVERQASVPQKQQSIEEIKTKIENLNNSQNSGCAAATGSQLQELIETHERLVAQQLDYSDLISDLREDLSNTKLQKASLMTRIIDKQNEAAKLESSIKECEDYILNELPQKRAEMSDIVLNALNALEQEFKFD